MRFWAGGVIVQSLSHAQLFCDHGLGDSDLNDVDKVAVFLEFTLLYPEFSPLFKFQTQVSHFLNSLPVRMAVLESLQGIIEKTKQNQTKPY